MTKEHVRRVLADEAKATAKRHGYCEADIPEIRFESAIYDLSLALSALENPKDTVCKGYARILLERYRQ